jgi:hypothetical protein
MLNADKRRQFRFWGEMSAAIALLMVIVWCILPPKPRFVGRDEFVKRGAYYHLQVAQACDQLLSIARDGMSNQRFQGTDKNLPIILRDLKATRIEVFPERIIESESNPDPAGNCHGSIEVGLRDIVVPKGSTNTHSNWQLTVNTESGGQVLLERDATTGLPIKGN